MKKIILLFSLFLFIQNSYSQTLYSNTNESGSRYNPLIGQFGTPKVAFDDILIPSSSLVGVDSLNVKMIKVAIRRAGTAGATNVNFFYTTKDDTATVYNTLTKIPPKFLGTVALPTLANAGFTTHHVSLGDSINTLFKVKVDTGNIYSNSFAFFLGASLSNNSSDNGIRIATTPLISSNDVNAFWMYDADTTAGDLQRRAASFAAPTINTFVWQVFGTTQTVTPVNLTTFTGVKNGSTNKLSWTTADEKNNKGFELQRSADGEKFSTIEFISSKGNNGNSVGTLEYEFIDAKPFKVVSYYRLKQVDFDGKSTLSKVVVIKDGRMMNFEISDIYPNPAKEKVNIVVSSFAERKANFIITDLTGKVVLQQNQQIMNGENNIQLNVNNLTAGTYLLKVVCDNGCETDAKKFIKL